MSLEIEFMRVARYGAKQAPWHAFRGVLGMEEGRSLCGRQQGMIGGRMFNVRMGTIPRYNDGSFCARCLELTDQLAARANQPT